MSVTFTNNKGNLPELKYTNIGMNGLKNMNPLFPTVSANENRSLNIFLNNYSVRSTKFDELETYIIPSLLSGVYGAGNWYELFDIVAFESGFFIYDFWQRMMGVPSRILNGYLASRSKSYRKHRLVGGMKVYEVKANEEPFLGLKKYMKNFITYTETGIAERSVHHAVTTIYSTLIIKLFSSSVLECRTHTYFEVHMDEGRIWKTGGKVIADALVKMEIDSEIYKSFIIENDCNNETYKTIDEKIYDYFEAGILNQNTSKNVIMLFTCHVDVPRRKELLLKKSNFVALLVLKKIAMQTDSALEVALERGISKAEIELTLQGLEINECLGGNKLDEVYEILRKRNIRSVIRQFEMISGVIDYRGKPISDKSYISHLINFIKLYDSVSPDIIDEINDNYVQHRNAQNKLYGTAERIFQVLTEKKECVAMSRESYWKGKNSFVCWRQYRYFLHGGMWCSVASTLVTNYIPYTVWHEMRFRERRYVDKILNNYFGAKLTGEEINFMVSRECATFRNIYSNEENQKYAVEFTGFDLGALIRTVCFIYFSGAKDLNVVLVFDTVNDFGRFLNLLNKVQKCISDDIDINLDNIYFLDRLSSFASSKLWKCRKETEEFVVFEEK